MAIVGGQSGSRAPMFASPQLVPDLTARRPSFAAAAAMGEVYLYRESLEVKERQHYEKKRRAWEALEEDKPIPTKLRNEGLALRCEIDLGNQDQPVARSIIDDEYAGATLREPKILLTTCHNPSAPLTLFVKRMNRGGQVISEIVESYRAHEIAGLILVHEHRGQRDGLIVCHLPLGPIAYFGLLKVVTRRDIKDKKAMGKMSEAYPRLMLGNFTTKAHQVWKDGSAGRSCPCCRRLLCRGMPWTEGGCTARSGSHRGRAPQGERQGGARFIETMKRSSCPRLN